MLAVILPWLIFTISVAIAAGAIGAVLDRKSSTTNDYPRCRACETYLSFSSDPEICPVCSTQIAIELDQLTLSVDERFKNLARQNRDLTVEVGLYNSFGFHAQNNQCMCEDCVWFRVQQNPIAKEQLKITVVEASAWADKLQKRRETHTMDHPWWGPLNEIIESAYSFSTREALKGLWKTSNTREEFLERFEACYAANNPRQAEQIRTLAKETE